MEKYYTCLLCVQDNYWPLGTIICETCKNSHVDGNHDKHIKSYNLKENKDVCDICNNRINKTIQNKQHKQNNYSCCKNI